MPLLELQRTHKAGAAQGGGGKKAGCARAMRPRSPAQCARSLLASLGVLLAAAGALVAIYWGDIFDQILARELELSPNSSAFSEWRAPSLPLYFDVYLFNWSNPEEFATDTPQLQQLGPYRYRETREKVQLTWHAHNRSVSYRTRRLWHFDAAASDGSLDDQVTTLNVVAASAAYRARDWSYARQKGVSVGLSIFGERIWVRRTAGELLFEGYEDPLLDFARIMPPDMTGGAPPVDRFGWFYERNGSLLNDGHMNVATGAGAESGNPPPGQILRWNYLDHAAHLPDACSKLSGSLGEFFPRRMQPPPEGAEGEQLVMFSPDLCRPLPFTYERRRELHGLPLLQYSAADHMLDNGTLYPENACFCSGECVPSGALNVSACRHGAPAFISLPHFYRADPSYRAAVSGMRPDPRLHNFYFAVEPTTGIPLDVAARFQLNILVAPVANIDLFASVPRVMFPVLWVEQRVRVDAVTAEAVGVARAAAAWGGAVAAALAAAALALGLLPLLLRGRRRAPPPAPSPAAAALLPPASAPAVLC